MKREKSAYLGMPFDYLYSIYIIFSVACIVKHVRIAWNAFRGRASPEVDVLDDSERI
jgi:TRAP-type C4-dicarboxylate transport system permease small subunit